MRTYFQHLTIRCSGKNGFALIFVLLILVLLTVIGFFALMTSNVDIQLTGNERQYKAAFYAAEAGIRTGCTALNTLKTTDSGSWDSLLAGTTNLDNYIDGIGERDLDKASFTLGVRDNDDMDGTLLVDSDNIIILICTGQYENATVEIETTVRYSGGGDQFAQEHYDTDSSGNATAESDAVTGTVRWN